MNMAKAGLTLWVICVAGLALALASQFGLIENHTQERLETNILALLPTSERNLSVENAIKQLSSQTENRIVLLLGRAVATHQNEQALLHAAQQFNRHLKNSHAFDDALLELPTYDIQTALQHHTEYAHVLLTEQDITRIKEGSFDWEGHLQQKMFSPFSGGGSLPLSTDPFGFGDRWIAETAFQTPNLSLENNILVSRTRDKDGSNWMWVLITAKLNGSAYDSDTQEKTHLAIQNAFNLTHAQLKDMQLLKMGAVFYADSAQKQAKKEVDMIGLISLLGIIGLIFSIYRSPRPIFLGVGSVMFGIATATCLTIYFYNKIHLITLVFGASLIGEAFDYSIQYFSARMGVGRAWHAYTGLRKVLPALGMALLTSILGYAALALAPFPALSQIAFFAIIGLSATCFSVLMICPYFLNQPSHFSPPTYLTALHTTLNAVAKQQLKHWQMIVALVLICIIAVPGMLKIHANDDIHLLIERSAQLVAQENKVKSILGLNTDTSFFVVEGETPEQLLKTEAHLLKALNTLKDDRIISGFNGISQFVPPVDRQQQNFADLRHAVLENQPHIINVMSDTGLKNDVIETWLKSFQSPNAPEFLTVAHWLTWPQALPFRHLWLGEQRSNTYATIVQLSGVAATEKLQALGQRMAGIKYVNKPASVSAQLKEYRLWSMSWLAGAMLLIVLALSLRYGLQRACLMTTPSLAAILLTAGILGYLGANFTLFNMMAFMLILGVGINYAIFLLEGGLSQSAALVGVILSASTTLLSFGMLTLSHMPALAGFGLTLLIGIGINVLLSPLSILNTKKTG